MHNSLVSIIIPIYNSAETLNKCFKSLDEQTYENIEVIFVNDGSTDKSLEILKEYCCGKDGRIIIDSKNEGVASARNKGLNRANGKWITFYDSDDILSDNHIENLVTVAENNGADISVCKYMWMKQDVKRFKNKDVSSVKSYTGLEWEEFFLSQRHELQFPTWNKLYSKKLLDDNGIRFIEGCRYGEDVYFNYVCFSLAKKVVRSYAETYCYVKNPKSLTHALFNVNRLTMYMSLNKMVEEGKERTPSLYQYTHSFRCCYSCEFLFYMKKRKFCGKEEILTILKLMKEDVPYLKKCRMVKLYRKLLVPLVPFAAKIAFRKVLK